MSKLGTIEPIETSDLIESMEDDDTVHIIKTNDDYESICGRKIKPTDTILPSGRYEAGIKWCSICEALWRAS